MPRSSLMLGVAVASAAAGPLFAATILLPVALFDPGPPAGITAAGLVGFLYLMVWALLFGFAIAFIPNLIGTLAMAALAERHAAARHPAAWVAAGVVLGAAIAWLFGANDALTMLPFLSTSAACAAICRAVGREEIGRPAEGGFHRGGDTRHRAP